MKLIKFTAFYFIFSFSYLFSEIYPIQFGIPSEKVIKFIPKKTQDCATVIPWHPKTYVFNTEKKYYQDYQKSYFAITCKKGGWDCMRHSEILANGCMPYFYDIDQCPPNTMTFLPKDLIKKAMNLKGVHYNGYNVTIDHEVFDKEEYFQILKAALSHTKKHLTAESMAKYILTTIQYKRQGPILYLSQEQRPDYLRCLMLIGLKKIGGEQIIDYPKIKHLYKSYRGNIKSMYGKGISYTKILDDDNVNRNRKSIEKKIKKRAFEFIVYGSCHRGLPFYNLVRKNYPKEKIIFICGEDAHKCRFKNSSRLFLREY